MNVDALRHLYSVCCTIPKDEFRLNLFYQKENGCVQGCGLGYAAVFNMCGLRIENEWQVPEYKHPGSGVTYRGMEAAIHAFGITRQDALDLFSGPGNSAYDKELVGRTHDKGLWVNRIERFFAEKGLQLEAVEAPQKETIEFFDGQSKMIASVLV